MRGNELLDRMELVEPVYLEAAEVYPKDKKRIHWKAVAAIFCVVLGGWLIWTFFPRDGIGTHRPPPSYIAGNTVNGIYGTVVYRADDLENHVMKFTLTLTEDVPFLCASMSGYKHLDSWIETFPDGQEYTAHKSEEIIAITPGRPDGTSDSRFIIREDLLIVTVDGKPAECLPTQRGTYEIQIDYSKVYEALDYVHDRIELTGFEGGFWVNKDWPERT